MLIDKSPYHLEINLMDFSKFSIKEVPILSPGCGIRLVSLTVVLLSLILSRLITKVIVMVSLMQKLPGGIKSHHSLCVCHVRFLEVMWFPNQFLLEAIFPVGCILGDLISFYLRIKEKKNN